MNKDVYLGIDIGGTSVKVGFVDEEGTIIKKWEIPMVKEDLGEHFLKKLWDSILVEKKELSLKEEQILAIGVGSAGFIHAEKGFIYKSVNIGWENFPLGEKLNELSNLPVFVENDANIAALGELWQGSGKGEDHLIMVTLGTGVGGGIIVNKQVLNGENGTAGEIGHMIVEKNGVLCNCGRKGCLETIASATGIVRIALEKIKENPQSKLALHYNKTKEITAKDVFQLAKAQDQVAKEIVTKVGEVLGLAIANLGAVINPGKVLIGGGVSRAGDQLLKVVQRAFQKYALPRVKNVCEIEIAKLENDAGIIGAAYLAKSKQNGL